MRTGGPNPISEQTFGVEVDLAERLENIHVFGSKDILSPAVPYQNYKPRKLSGNTCFFFRCKNGGFPEGGVITEKGGEHYRKERWVDWFIYMCMGCTGRRYLE